MGIFIPIFGDFPPKGICLCFCQEPEGAANMEHFSPPWGPWFRTVARDPAPPPPPGQAPSFILTFLLESGTGFWRSWKTTGPQGIMASLCGTFFFCSKKVPHCSKSTIWDEAEILQSREFPGSPVVKTSCFHCRGAGSIAGWGVKIPCAAGQKKKEIFQSIPHTSIGAIFWTRRSDHITPLLKPFNDSLLSLSIKFELLGISLAVQWLGLGAFIAGAGFNPWSGN